MENNFILNKRQISVLLGATESNYSAKELSLLNNPFISGFDCFLIEYILNDEVVGQVTTIPLEIMAYNDVYSACGGSGLSVDERFRGRGIAATLTKERLELSKDRIAIAAGLSNMSFPLFKKLGFITFRFPRLILLKKSRAVIESFIGGCMLKFISSLVDKILQLYLLLLRKFTIWERRNVIIKEVFNATEEIANIVASDKHPFKEHHTKEWFNWALRYPFNDDSRTKQHLFQIMIDGKVQAFFMTKERFYEQASHRGFKNVILGSVIEWGVGPDQKITEKQVCKAALFSFGKHVDAVEICMNDRKLIHSLKLMGMIKVGESNMAFKATDESPFQKYKKEYNSIDNWRIRPAFSDNGLS